MKRRVTRRQPMPPRPELPATILTFDLGTRKCGWALARLDAAGRVVQRKSGCILLEQHGPELWRRVHYFAQWLSWACKEWGITYLAAEEPYPGAHKTQHGLYLLVDLASGRLFGRSVHGISRIAVFRGTVGWCRRTARQGKRTVVTTPSKTEMMAAINARHGFAQGRRITSEDEADAVAALDLLLAELAGTGIRHAPVLTPPPVRSSTKAAAATLFKSKLRVVRRPAA